MKKNVIIIMADQLRADALGLGFSPNIDMLMSESVNFTQAYCACPLCVPARGALFTGKWPSVNGSLINPWCERDEYYGQVHSGIDNLYTLMEKDWYSIHSGKQHLFTEGCKLEDRDVSLTHWASTEESYFKWLEQEGVRPPGGPAFRTLVPELIGGKTTHIESYSNANTGCYPADGRYYFDNYFTDKTIEALRNRERNKPLLLNAMFLAPHPPLEIPQPWFSRVEEDDFTLPENVGVYFPHQSPLQMYNLPGVVGARYKREEWKESWRVYLGLVGLLDDCVGRITAELKDQGIYDESFIVFTSDHGEMLGSHGLFQKMCMYQEAVRVPLSIHFPSSMGIGPCRRDRIVSHVDILPTIADLFDIPHSGVFDGESLMDTVLNDRCVRNDTAFIQYDGNGSLSNFQRCVVHGRYKFIADIFKDETFFELYDVKNDPQEKDNLIFDESSDAISREMADMLAWHMKTTGDRLPCPVFDAEMQRLYYG